MIKRSWVRVLAGAARKCSSPGSTFCADSYFGIFSTTRVTYLSTYTGIKYKKIIILGGISPFWKMDTGKHNFQEILLFKLSKKIEKG